MARGAFVQPHPGPSQSRIKTSHLHFMEPQQQMALIILTKIPSIQRTKHQKLKYKKNKKWKPTTRDLVMYVRLAPSASNGRPGPFQSSLLFFFFGRRRPVDPTHGCSGSSTGAPRRGVSRTSFPIVRGVGVGGWVGGTYIHASVSLGAQDPLSTCDIKNTSPPPLVPCCRLFHLPLSSTWASRTTELLRNLRPLLSRTN